MVGGVALRGAADAIIERAKGMAGALMEAATNDIEFKDGKFTVVGTDKAIAMTDVAKAFYAPAGPVLKFGLGLEAVRLLYRRAGRAAELSQRLPGL